MTSSSQLPIAAHPTLYAGTMFRSRLEARWAAFFDICGWSWQYEPVDCRGWVPDFFLIGSRWVTPVEVKPINWHGGAAEMVRLATNTRSLDKVRRYRGDSVLILGAYPATWRVGSNSGGCALGLLTEEDPSWEGREFDTATLVDGFDGGELDFISELGSSVAWMGGEAVDRPPASIRFVRDLWGNANAATQWRPAGEPPNQPALKAA